MPLPLYIEHDGRRITWRDVSAAVGLSKSSATARIRRGTDLFAPKADHREAARRNPDPWGHKARRGER